MSRATRRRADFSGWRLVYSSCAGWPRTRRSRPEFRAALRRPASAQGAAARADPHTRPARRGRAAGRRRIHLSMSRGSTESSKPNGIASPRTASWQGHQTPRRSTASSSSSMANSLVLSYRCGKFSPEVLDRFAGISAAFGPGSARYTLATGDRPSFSATCSASSRAASTSSDMGSGFQRSWRSERGTATRCCRSSACSAAEDGKPSCWSWHARC